MIYPKNFESKIQFDKIRELISAECLSPMGTQRVQEICFSSDPSEISARLQLVSEAKQILKDERPFPKSNYLDVFNSLKKIKVEGAILEEEELFEFYLSYRTVGRILEFFDDFGEEYSALRSLAQSIFFNDRLLYQCEVILDDHGKIRDNASTHLSVIRKEKRGLEEMLRTKVDMILKRSIKKGYSAEGLLPTVRDGRMVIPVFAEHKRHVNGFIHGESATGQTVYIEPGEVLGLNNNIKELWYKEQREIYRILFEVSEEIRPHLSDIRLAFNFLGDIDFIMAKARFAHSLNCIHPEIKWEQQVRWKGAEHPILKINHVRQGKKIVPLDVELNTEQSILVISGPNAGGKSVCLQTVALLQYMFQCGLLVPVDESSEFGIFEDIFIDIGDEQSIENDLSTYSSHLNNLNFFLKNSNSKSLVLVDEFGSGTDPQFGAAIAEAILLELVKSGCQGVITTHYSNIKKIAESEDKLINGAMLFDLKQLKPLYKLEIGHPGSSFAFEIAQNLGMDRGIIDKAKEKVGFSQVN
jgi:DNA mismatch repair protein MutS2